MPRAHRLARAALHALGLQALAALTMAPTAGAQSTVRPLPAFGFDAPLAPALTLAPLPAGPATGGSAGTLEAAAPTGAATADQAAWRPLSPEGAAADTWTGSIELSLVARDDTGLLGTPGNVASQRARATASLLHRDEAGRALALSFSSEASFYRFGKATALVPGSANPFNDLYRTSLAAQFASTTGEGLAWLGGFEVSTAGEDLVDPTDSVVLGGLAGLRYRPAPDLALTLGLAGESRLEDGAWAMPFLGLEWAATDTTRLLVQGSQARLEQDLGAAWTLYAGADYEVRQWRLNAGGPLPSGVFRDEEIRLALGAELRAGERATFGLEVSQGVWSELTFLDDAGALVGSSEADDAVTVSASLRLAF